MGYKLPDRPWDPERVYEITLDSGEVIRATYDAEKNAWLLIRDEASGGGIGGFVTTKDVYTLNTRPSGISNPFDLTNDPNTVINQQEANWWLFEDLKKKQRKVIVQNVAPTSHPLYTTIEADLVDGDLWYDTSLLEMFIYWQGAWFPTSAPPADFDLEVEQIQYDVNRLKALLDELYLFSQTTDDKYVKKVGGDEMEGPLKVTGGRNPNADGIESTVETLNVDSGESSTLNLKWNGQTKAYLGDTQLTLTNDLKFNTGGKAIYATGPDKKGFVVNDRGVFYDGEYSNDRHVATKRRVEEAIFDDPTDLDSNKYVDRTGDIMSGDLILEESRLVFRNPDGDQTLIRANRDSGAYPVLLDLVNNNTVGATPGGYDIKIGGSTAYNALRFVGQDTYLSINGGGGSPTPVKFHKDVDCGHSRFTKLGRATDDDDAVPYGQVKEELTTLRDEFLQDLIVGTWGVDQIQNLTNPGTDRMCFISNTGALAATKFSEVDVIRFHYIDDQGTMVQWQNWDPGELITFRQIDDPSVTAIFRILSPVNENGTTRSFSVEFIKAENDTDPFGTYMERYAVTLTEFDAGVDGGALDSMYLRLDCSNDPLETQLHIKTPDFGEAALSLIGKRDNLNNSTATVAFKSQFDTGESYAGYLTYRTTGQANDGYFRFNRDLDLNQKVLKNLSSINFTNVGVIKANDNQKVVIRNAGNDNDGNSNVTIERPPNQRRGFAIRGNDSGGDEIDMLYSYANPSGGDAVNYRGKIASDTNIVNKGYVDDAIASIGSGANVGLEHTPYIANMAGTKSGINSNEPGPNQVAGFYTSGTSDGSRNEFPGNFNSLLKCGSQVVAVQEGTNNYAELPDGHDERWTGTVSVIDLNTGGLLYKNTIVKVNRSGEYIYVWVREPGSAKGNKPMFAYGNVSNWTNISVLIEGYRVK
jgi:hypothetical protein